MPERAARFCTEMSYAHWDYSLTEKHTEPLIDVHTKLVKICFNQKYSWDKCKKTQKLKKTCFIITWSHCRTFHKLRTATSECSLKVYECVTFFAKNCYVLNKNRYTGHLLLFVASTRTRSIKRGYKAIWQQEQNSWWTIKTFFLEAAVTTVAYHQNQTQRKQNFEIMFPGWVFYFYFLLVCTQYS